jgi:hypothetical protein
MDYWIIDEIWREIKTYLFHNIKIHGKHLKNNIHIQQFNKTLKDIPKLYIPRLGPRIIYNFNKFKFAKFLYKIPSPSNITNKRNLYKLIIEYAPISNKNYEEINELYIENITTTSKVY